MEAGRFQAEIIGLPGLKGQIISRDGSPRSDSSPEVLAKLRQPLILLAR